MDAVWLPFLFGVLAGGLGGLMGVGGGIILIPLLVHVLHRSQHEAHGTSLAFIVAVSLAAGGSYLHRGSLDVPLAALLAMGAVPGVLLGARVARALSGRRLRQIFGLFVLATAVRLLALPPHPAPGGAPWHPLLSVLLGCGAGLVAGLMGVGGGIVLVPVLVLAQRIDQHTAQGISLLVIIPTAVVGAWRYARHGDVATRLLPALMLGGAAGALLGAGLAHRLAAPQLSRIFALFLLPVAVQMIWSPVRRGVTVGAEPAPPGGDR
jgi:hypothetical protein